MAIHCSPQSSEQYKCHRVMLAPCLRGAQAQRPKPLCCALSLQAGLAACSRVPHLEHRIRISIAPTH